MIKKKFTLLILLHSSHRCCKPLNISIPTCNLLVFLMSLMSLAYKSDISDVSVSAILYCDVWLLLVPLLCIIEK